MAYQMKWSDLPVLLLLEEREGVASSPRVGRSVGLTAMTVAGRTCNASPAFDANRFRSLLARANGSRRGARGNSNALKHGDFTAEGLALRKRPWRPTPPFCSDRLKQTGLDI